MRTKQALVFTLTLTLLLASCMNKDTTVILKGHDFSSGEWFLVNVDSEKHILKIIDNETVLANNPSGIKVNWSEEHSYTTCDGILKLYKDGELIAQQDYLDQSCINESSEIREAYRNASDDSVYPNDKADFERQWDSLKRIKNCYPTRYHTQPDDKDIIWFYKHE